MGTNFQLKTRIHFQDIDHSNSRQIKVCDSRVQKLDVGPVIGGPYLGNPQELKPKITHVFIVT